MIIRYGAISVFVTVIDIFVSRLGENYTNMIIANTIGVVTGFVIQFFLTAKYVFRSKGIYAFNVFLGTFLFGLFLANGIVYVVRVLAFESQDSLLIFFIGKFFSIVIPFFITYIIRKKLLVEGE